jgi:hypothetical protein
MNKNQPDPHKSATIGHADHGKHLLMMLLLGGLSGLETSLAPGTPKKDCLNCEYMAIWQPGDEGHCYMFAQEPPRDTCGQFRKLED